MGNFLGSFLVGLMASTQESSIGVAVAPVIFAFLFVSALMVLKYFIQDILLMILNTSKEEEPKTFDDIRKVRVEELPKEWTNKRSLHEKLRRVKKEDFEFIVIFLFIMVPYLIYSQGGIYNFAVGSKEITTKDAYGKMKTEKETILIPSNVFIASSVIGCCFIVAFLVLRVIGVFMIFSSAGRYLGKLRVASFTHLLLFALFSLIMAFLCNYYQQPSPTDVEPSA